MFSRLGRWVRMFLLIGCLLAVAALIAGVFYERVQRDNFRRNVPSPGAAVDIGGRSMNIYCTGEGHPAVIFEPGYDWPGMSWAAVQSKISPFTRACWYDRAGAGWSDPAPFPRTDEAVAQDLHALLVAAAIQPPYLLVGPRFGGHSMFVFHAQYPEQVAGMLLIDGQVDDTAPLPPPFLLYPLNVAAQVFARSGLLRLLDSPVSTRRLPF